MLIFLAGMPVFIDAEDYDLVTEKKWAYNNGYLRSGYRRNGVHYTFALGKYIHMINRLDVPGTQVCHKNGNPLDCRKCNLVNRTLSEKRKLAKAYQRMQGKSRRNNLPFGVYYTRNKKAYYVVVKIKGKATYLGQYDDLDEATAKALEFLPRALTK